MKFFLLLLPLLFGFVMTPSLATESFTLAKMSWNEGNFHKGLDFFAKKIQILDTDGNQNPDNIEKIPVLIYSDSDPVGITVNAHETGKNTGIFEILVYFSQKELSSGQRLHSDVGDAVTAQYTDRTVPGMESMQISDTFKIDSFSTRDDPISDPSFFRQGLQTGETIPNIFVIQIIEGLGAGLIVLFIVIYAIKRRSKE